jgi:predicted nucleic acid-binding protein
LAFKIEKVKTKYKNSALCLNRKVSDFLHATFHTQTVGNNINKEMANTLITNHNNNLSNLDDIIFSIREYLNVIQSKPRFRDEKNRTESVREWMNSFIDCKENLNLAFGRIINAKEKAHSKYQVNKKSLEQLASLIKQFPELNFDSQESLSLRYNTQISSKSKQANIRIYDAWDKTRETNLDIVETFYNEVSLGFEHYNNWISKTEKNLSFKHYDLSTIQSMVKSLFQENKLAKHLYETISQNRFNHLQLPNNFNENYIE